MATTDDRLLLRLNRSIDEAKHLRKDYDRLRRRVLKTTQKSEKLRVQWLSLESNGRPPPSNGTSNTHMRIVLRKPDEASYLQRSGKWPRNRETARSFESTRIAYFWHREQNLQGIEVLFVFDHSKHEVVVQLT